MQFDDHEIWGAPVQTQTAPEPQRIAEPVAASSATGRLYKSAGCEEPVEAVVALPTRRHTSIHPMAHARAASSSLTPPAPHGQPSSAQSSGTASGMSVPQPSSPIALNSRIPRQIEDPAIAEVLSAPVFPAPEAPAVDRPAHEGFTSWFRAVRGSQPDANPHAWADPDQPAGQPARQAARPRAAAPVPPSVSPFDESHSGDTPRRPQQSNGFTPAEREPMGKRSIGLGAIGLGAIVTGTRSFAVALFAITTLVALVDERVSGGLSTLTGVVFLLSTTAGAWALPAGHRWAGRVLPAYVLMASILVAGQFGQVAPGRSIIGQALLIVSGLLSLAPWLAAATLIATLIPRRRGA